MGVFGNASDRRSGRFSASQGKRYRTSCKEREHPKLGPYAILKAPKGQAMCRKCLAIYADKRWYFDEAVARKLAAPRARKLVRPACQKFRDDYPEGIVTF